MKTDVKIPSLLPSLVGQSTTSARPMQIYMDVGLSLNSINYIFPNYVFEQNISFSIYKKIKVKGFYCRCYVVKLLTLYFLFFISLLFKVFLVSLVM